MNIDILKNKLTPFIFSPLLLWSLYEFNTSHWFGLIAWVSGILLVGWSMIYIDRQMSDGK